MAKGTARAGTGTTQADAARSPVVKLKETAKAPVAKAAEVIRTTSGPSPNPMTNLIIADIAFRGGGRLLRHALEKTLLGAKYDPQKADNIVKGRSMKQTLIGTALARVATRSVPGALLVGGGLLAKTLYDRTKDHRTAKIEGEQQVAKQARRAQG